MADKAFPLLFGGTRRPAGVSSAIIQDCGAFDKLLLKIPAGDLRPFPSLCPPFFEAAAAAIGGKRRECIALMAAQPAQNRENPVAARPFLGAACAVHPP